VSAAASFIAQFSDHKADPRCADPTSGKFATCLDSVFKELLRYEKVPNRREPLTWEMIDELYQRNQRAGLHEYHRDVQLYHWPVVGVAIGQRRIEWCQLATPQTRGLLNPECDDRDHLPRAFILDDIECFSATGACVPAEAAVSNTQQVESIDIQWRFQKNNENGEKKKITRNPNKNSKHCRVESFLAILRCRLALAPSNNTIPLAVYLTSSNTPAYITDTDVREVLRSVAAKVYSLNPNDEHDRQRLRRWSCHSMRVGACVILHAMGFSATDIKFILRWKSDAFMAYLRNLSFLARQHAIALDRAAAIPHFAA
jgi:hypothetical protein